ncbi:MAG: M20/M25/M40 family metallo-hydrolase [Planctomycetota bacterium]|nr:M20/M25/M40 family metallo-hydrolase [Planctomycetota bacterium]
MIKLNEDKAIRRVMDLISISGGSGQEQHVSAWIQKTLKDAGVPESAISIDTAHKTSPAGGTTGNLIVKLKGTVKGPRRLLMAHMDTVPLCAGCQPVREGDWIRPKSKDTALGGDNRAGCGVVLTAILETLSQGLDYPPLTLLFTVQEEIGLRGARFLNAGKLGKPALCFNWDGRDPNSLITGAVGANNLSIRIEGIASHAGAHPEDGVNAAVVASIALAQLQKNGWHGLVRKGKGRGSSNLGVIRGGDATNVVMPSVAIQAEARSHDSTFRQHIVAAWREAFETAIGRLSNANGQHGTLTFEEDVRYEAFRIPDDSDCVLIAKSASEAVGLKPVAQTCDGGLDANWMALHGFPAVTMGCGQHEIHTVKERLFIPEYLAACKVGLTLATAAT